MDIYEFALQMEKDGEDYYRDQALKEGNKGLKNIFTFLADAEAQHGAVEHECGVAGLLVDRRAG